jgi:hypothetical protein
LKVISEEIIEEDDQKYKVTKYDSGHVVKEAYSEIPDDYVPPLPEMSESETRNLEMASNIEYLVAVSELDM